MQNKKPTIKKLTCLVLAVVLIFTLIPAAMTVSASAAKTPAQKWVDDERARFLKLYNDECKKAVQGLENLIKIDIFMECEAPKKFNLKSAIIDEGVGYLLGEILGNVYSFYDYASTIKGIVKPDDAPDNMIYTIQSIARADFLALRSMVIKGFIAENGYYELEKLREAAHLAERVYNYQQSLYSNFNYQALGWTLSKYYAELQKVNFYNINMYLAQWRVMNSVQTQLNSKAINTVDKQKVEKFKSDYTAFVKKYGELFDGRGIFPKQPDYNAGLWDADKSYTGEAFFSLQFLNYDPLRVLTLEGKTRRAADLATLISSALPVGGGILSSAYNSIDDKAKGNIMMSIALPNVFYQEYAVKMRNETFFEAYVGGEWLSYIGKLIEEANKTPNGNIYPVILQALADFSAWGYGDNGGMIGYFEKDRIPTLTDKMAQVVYTEVMAADLFALVLTNDTGNRNKRYIDNILFAADDTMKFLWGLGLMKTDRFGTNVKPESGVTYFAYSKDKYFDNDNNMKELDKIRVAYVNTLMKIVDLSMDNNQLDKTAKGKSKIDFMTPLGQNGNKIYYDQKTLFNGTTRVLKAVETESTNSSKPKYVCYFDVAGTPVYLKNMQTGKSAYGGTYLLGDHPQTIFYRADPIVFAGDTDDMLNEFRAWWTVKNDIGVKNDGDVTRALDRARGSS